MSRSVKLSQRFIRRLGKIADVTLAAEAGVSVQTIQAARTRRGLPPASRETFKWTADRLGCLGSVPDHELARRWGCAPNTVGSKRRKLGIPPAVPQTGDKQHRWTSRQLAWLGQLTDREIADRIGLSATSVRQKRQVLGIQPTQTRRPGTHDFQWARADIALLGTMSDGAVANELGITRNAVQDKRRQLQIPSAAEQQAVTTWTSEILARLGQEPDRVIAAELGISTSAVSAYRSRRGIPAARRYRE